MKQFEKMYIGKGNANKKIDSIIDVCIDMEKAEAFIFEYNGKKYLKFEMATRMAPDQFGRTHTVYVNKRVETPEAEATPARARGRKKKTA